MSTATLEVKLINKPIEQGSFEAIWAKRQTRIMNDVKIQLILLVGRFI